MNTNSDVFGRGVPSGVLKDSEVEEIVSRGLDALPLANQRVLVLIPDGTRTMPMPLFFRIITRQLLPRARAVDFLVALGTHLPMSDEALRKHVGISAEEHATTYKNVRLLNHAWDNPAALEETGRLPADEIASLTSGRMNEEVVVRLNRLVLEYDHLLVCGPVFPHEVVGFSGGHKYFFPGIAGPDIIDMTHWLGALVGCIDIIGVKDTPVRRVIEAAARLIPRPRHAICSVVTHEGVAGVFVGTPDRAWSAAADVSAERHIVWVDKPYKQVLAVMPPMYDELWVGGKGMYKSEPAVADGGEVIIYAPHIREISAVHGKSIREVGYHVRDYFLAQWDRFKHVARSTLAHSSHVKGAGTFVDGVERPRVTVTLATGISEEDTRAVNLEYRDPRSIDPKGFSGRESEGVLCIPKAGEYLYRVRRAQNG